MHSKLAMRHLCRCRSGEALAPMLDGVRWFVLVTRVVLLLGGGSGAPLTISITIGGCGDADPTTWLRGRARYTRHYKARRFVDDDVC